MTLIFDLSFWWRKLVVIINLLRIGLWAGGQLRVLFNPERMTYVFFDGYDQLRVDF